jgi:hypothetical protein
MRFFAAKSLGCSILVVMASACAGGTSAPAAPEPPDPELRPASGVLRAPAPPRDQTEVTAARVSAADEQAPFEPKAPEWSAPCNFWVDFVSGGARMMFQAGTSSAEDVKADARALADALNAAKAGAEGEHRAVTFGIRKIMELGPAVRVDDTPDGASISLTVADLDLQDELRARILWHSADLLPGYTKQQARCPVIPGEEPARGSAKTTTSSSRELGY